MTHLEMAKLIVDFGLVVLIWLVQLVIYPSFQYYQVADLKRWHAKYTGRITFVVMPLMLTQLLLHSIVTFRYPDGIHITSLTLVVVLWIITFLRAIPLHQQIEQHEDTMLPSRQLLSVNLVRALLWTLVFGLNLLFL